LAGHSHSANIRHKKGANDAKRGKIFSKHARAIFVAARLGGGDPEMNLRLKYAIEKAKSDNTPKDNIERAIRKGCGESDGASYETVIYEGYLAGGVAVLIDTLTDNRNRTVPELRSILERRGGNLAASGSVAWIFEQKSIFRVSAENKSEEDLLEVAAEVGADDVERVGPSFEIVAEARSFAEIRNALGEQRIEVEAAEITYRPKNTVEIEDENMGRKVFEALDDLENCDDVQNTYANFEMDEALLEKLAE